MQNKCYKKSIVFGIVLMLVFSVFILRQINVNAAGEYSSYFAGGDGTEGDPYQIANVDQLQNMSLDLDAYYVLVNDIDASETSTWNGGYGFIPVGDYSNRFTGSLDGQGYSITGLFIDECCENYVGLFRYVGWDGSVSNVGLINNNIIGCDYDHGYVGGISGENSGTISDCYATGTVSGNSVLGGISGENSGTISNCYATGTVSGNSFVGGLIGSNNHGTISNSYALGAVSGTKERVGGLTGFNRDGTISNSYALGAASGDDWVGGLVGQNYDGTILNCYATGAVSGDDDVGGLTGYNYYCTVSNCYATGAVSGNHDVGGLTGHNRDGTISECYATGAVSGDYNVGGLIGYSYLHGTVSNCFWDIETSGQSTSVGGTGKTTAEMKDIATFTDTSTVGLDSPWDFIGNPNDDTGSEDIWDINEVVNDGYPYNRWPAASIDSVVQPFSKFILPLHELEFTGSFNDPDPGDTHTIEWDFDDGTIVTGTLTPTHTYTTPGIYTVILTVTDDDGDTGVASVEIVVETPAGATDDVVEDIEELDLPVGVETALTSTLDAAINSLDNGHITAAINQLNAFINQVNAQRTANKLTDEEADALIAAAQWIIDNIS